MCTLLKKLVSKKEKSEMAISLVDSAFSELYHPPPVLLTVFFLCRVFIDFIGGLLVEDNVYCPSGSSLSALQWETQRHM